MHEMFEYANSNASSTSTCTTNTLNSAASIPTTTIGATNTRKRSKRISDCIAMLTGKLEEKLKTEQQPIQTPATFTKVAAAIEVQSTINVVNESQQQQTPSKTPKRKAQSRRILKPPSIENIVAQVEATPTTIATIATIIPTTTTTSTLVASHLLPPPPPPQLPLLPKRNVVATTLTVASTATPLSSVDSSNTKTTITNKIHQSINLPLPLTLPLPMGLPLPTALPIQLRPILQNNNNFEEPLNLSNASKNDKPMQTNSQNANTFNNATYLSNIYDLNTSQQQIYQQADMVGPLDLSTKSYRNNINEMTASSIANIMPLALTVIPTSNMNTINQHQQQKMLATSSSSSSAATSAALFINECNKNFYSNLDLLKIPQVRSQLAAATTISSTIPPLNAHVYAANVDNNMTGHMLHGATKATMVVAPIVKKRGNNRQQQHNITTTLPTTRIIRLYPNKKEHQLTMNEEVINHIDDAINSVINAVKASLTPERADDELEKYATTITTASTITTATTTNSFTIATVLPTITTTTATVVLPASILTTTTTVNKPQLAPIIPIKRRGRSKIAEQPILTATINEVSPLTTTTTEISNADTITTNTNVALETTTKTNDIPTQEPLTEQVLIENNVTKQPTTTTTTISEKIDDKKIINENEKELENISEQPTPPAAQKKFRRRRKNELAAIVADQLLESFKIDKARRDSLKKLENLAYEHKSDDLFMTGMLLMSSTKRSVTINNAQQTDALAAAAAATTTKRVSLRNRQNNNNNNNNSTTTTTTTTAKRGRRAGSGGTGRRGKTLDNKNISKLKSSLASFSIGIERQLTEIEAKKELQQQQQQQQKTSNKSNETNISNNNKETNTTTTTTKTTTSSILRPSILSAAAAPLTAENVAKISEQSRSAFACRDPRLNKNIHKETDEESLHKKCSKHSADAPPPPNDYEEEDNYLTEIAKNVNEKIMAAENEDFMFANDGLLQLDDTSSQFYSRPATSMSVRSAPNFDDRSDFGSLCGDDDDDDDEEEHTNTEVMDMDLDDEMSVYTSFSQDLGRGACGRRRRRRRRRSILLTRRPKKRIQRNQQDTEKFECTLCKKIFFSATSLSKHNMTLAHVSKVSEQEYLLSKAALLDQGIENVLSEFPSLPKPNTTTRRAKTPTTTNRARKTQVKASDDVKILEQQQQQQNIETKVVAPLTTQNASHVGLNSDERLFFECCTILKGTQHDQENSAQKQEDSNNFSPYQYHLNNKVIAESKKNDKNVIKSSAHKKHTKSQSTFRDPPEYKKNEK